MPDYATEFFGGLFGGIFEFVAIEFFKALAIALSSSNVPEWDYLLFVIIVIGLLLADFAGYVSGLMTTLGFAAGAWLVGDQWIAVLAIIIYAAIQIGRSLS